MLKYYATIKKYIDTYDIATETSLEAKGVKLHVRYTLIKICLIIRKRATIPYKIVQTDHSSL